MKRFVSELPKRIAVLFNQFSQSIALWDQSFKGYWPSISQEKVHPDILETFARHSEKT